MTKDLGKMTNEELGMLFPIIIADPDPDWAILYKVESGKILKVLGREFVFGIEHIGSTAIPGIKAKPTIDILMQIPDSANLEKIQEGLKSIDYQPIPRPENPAPHMMFVKGYTINGFKGQAFHVHVRYRGDWDEPWFRDYLINNPSVAMEYENLKISLSEKFKNDRDGYTEMKTDFVKRINILARNELKS